VVAEKDTVSPTEGSKGENVKSAVGFGSVSSSEQEKKRPDKVNAQSITNKYFFIVKN